MQHCTYNDLFERAPVFFVGRSVGARILGRTRKSRIPRVHVHDIILVAAVHIIVMYKYAGVHGGVAKKFAPEGKGLNFKFTLLRINRFPKQM